MCKSLSNSYLYIYPHRLTSTTNNPTQSLGSQHRESKRKVREKREKMTEKKRKSKSNRKKERSRNLKL